MPFKYKIFKRGESNLSKSCFIGAIQMVFMSMNVFYMSHQKYAESFVTTFITSFLFAYCVKILAFGKKSEMAAYSIGCSFGCIIGLITTKFI